MLIFAIVFGDNSKRILRAEPLCPNRNRVQNAGMRRMLPLRRIYINSRCNRIRVPGGPTSASVSSMRGTFGLAASCCRKGQARKSGASKISKTKIPIPDGVRYCPLNDRERYLRPHHSCSVRSGHASRFGGRRGGVCALRGAFLRDRRLADWWPRLVPPEARSGQARVV